MSSRSKTKDNPKLAKSTDLKSIKVIEQIDEIKDFHKLTPDELNIYLDRLGNVEADNEQFIIDLRYMIEYDNAIDGYLEKPNIPELLLRKVIQFGQDLFLRTLNAKDPNIAFVVLPIIPELNFRKKMQEYKDVVKVRMNKIVYCVTVNGKTFVASSSEEIPVIGLRISPICNNTKDISGGSDVGMLNIDYNISKISDVFDNAGKVTRDFYFEDFFRMGTYDIIEIARGCIVDPPDYSFGSFIKIGQSDKYVEGKFASINSPPSTFILNVFDYFTRFIKYYQKREIHIGLYNRLRERISKVRTIGYQLLSESSRELSNITEKQRALLISLESIIGTKISTKYTSNIFHTLDNTNLYHSYVLAGIKGKDSKEVQFLIDIARARINRERFQKDVYTKQINELNLLTSYKVIIDLKFGEKRLNELEEKLTKIKRVTPEVLLNALTKNESKITVNEYEKRKKYMEEMINNDCPHVPLHRRFRKAISLGRIARIYDDLKRFFTKIPPRHTRFTHGWIKCNNCKFDLICPHVVEYTELLLEHKPHIVIRKYLFDYVDKTPYQGNYYCLICGEVVANIQLFSDDKVTQCESDLYSSIQDELRNQMWGEMMTLVKNFQFKILIDIGKIINSMIDTCYEYISDIEQQLLKSKTNTSEDIKNKKRLFINIYGYAYMINLILSNKNLEISLKGGNKSLTGVKLIEIMKTILIYILSNKNILINKISGVTVEFIKNKLIDAYKLISSSGTQVVQYSSGVQDIYTSLVTDPIYKYIFEINHIGRGYNPVDFYKKIEYILNIDINKIGKLGKKPQKIKEITKKGIIESEQIIDDIFGKAKIPSFAQWGIDKFMKLPKLKYGYTTGICGDALKGYKAKSFQHFYSRIENKLHFEYIYNNDGSISKKFVDYSKEYVKFKEQELRFVYYCGMKHLKTFTYHQGIGEIKFKDPYVSLGRSYDERGNKHIWDIFVYSKDKNKDREELKKSEIIKLVADGKGSKQYIDKRCSVCGILLSEFGSLDENKIKNSLRRKIHIENLFKFYENRCPEGGLHEYPIADTINIQKCVKCGFSPEMLRNINSGESLDYYKKYKEKYIEESKTKIEDESPKKQAVATDNAKATTTAIDYSKEFAKWSFNYNEILDLSNILKLNNNAIIALGSIEKQNYEDVLNGAFIPPVIETMYSTRIVKIDSYLREIFHEYNSLRFYGIISKHAEYLVKIMETSGIKPSEFSKLEEQMPEIYDDYDGKIKWFKQNKKPQEVIEFIIHFIVKSLLLIYKKHTPMTKQLQESFAKNIINYILERDKLTTIHDRFNWNVFVKKGEQFKETSTYNPNYDDKMGIETTDDMDRDDLGDTSEPFKNTFDVDINHDEDEDHLGDNEVVMDLGEEYGLN